MKVQDVHAEGLALSSALSGLYVVRLITPLDVIAVLNAAGVSFVLVGAHGLVGWMNEPRATQDVDVVVASRHHKKAIRALSAAFPDLEVRDAEVVTRLMDPSTQRAAVDVMKATQPLFREVLKRTHAVRSGGQEYKIPSVEMAAALKFGPMVSPNREDAKKYLDAHDFILIVRHNLDLDMDELAELGELVYPGGGAEVVEFVRRARAGEKLNL